MARPLRIEYPGAIYHVMNRGDGREAIFEDDTDRDTFLRTLGEACGKTGWQVHAWCLMGNHFHLVLETPRGNLVAGMKWLMGTYTQRYSRRHKKSGHLFQGRYKAQVIDGDTPGYLRTACDSVHLNPVRARLLRAGEPMGRWRWSSFRDYVRAPSARPAWMRTDRLRGEHGIWRDDARGRRRLAAAMEARRAEETDRPPSPLRGSWVLGAEDFVERLVEKVRVTLKPPHRGREREETEEAVAERLIAAELRAAGARETELPALRKGDALKVAIARALRRETTWTLAQIARRLHMGAATHVAHLLYHRKP